MSLHGLNTLVSQLFNQCLPDSFQRTSQHLEEILEKFSAIKVNYAMQGAKRIAQVLTINEKFLNSANTRPKQNCDYASI